MSGVVIPSNVKHKNIVIESDIFKWIKLKSS